MNIKKIIEELVLFAKDLNSHDIRWTLGASLLLYLEGYDVSVSDIDIVVHEDDYKLLLDMLKDYKVIPKEPNEVYVTTHFFPISPNDVKIDVMIDFKVKKDDQMYHFPFHIEQEIQIQNTTIYLSSVDEWLQAYKAMNRIDKVLLIQTNKKRNIS